MRRDKWEKQKAEQNRDALVAKLRLIKDCEDVFGTPAGLRVLRWLFEITGLFADYTTSDNAYSRQSEGRRSIGLTIWHYAEGPALKVQAEDYEQTKLERLHYERELADER